MPSVSYRDQNRISELESQITGLQHLVSYYMSAFDKERISKDALNAEFYRFQVEQYSPVVGKLAELEYSQKVNTQRIEAMTKLIDDCRQYLPNDSGED